MDDNAGILLTAAAWTLIAVQVWQTRHERARRRARAAHPVDWRAGRALD